MAENLERIKCVFFSEFDNTAGPKIVYQYPEDYISVPGQLSGIKGGAISSSGCKEYYIRFRSKE